LHPDRTGKHFEVDMGEVLFGLFFVCLIIMVIGHGMWVVVAWLFRGCRPKQNASYEPTLADDHSATARHARRLLNRKLIDQQTHDNLLKAVAEDASPNRTPTQIANTLASELPPIFPDIEASEPAVPHDNHTASENKAKATQPHQEVFADHQPQQTHHESEQSQNAVAKPDQFDHDSMLTHEHADAIEPDSLASIKRQKQQTLHQIATPVDQSLTAQSDALQAPASQVPSPQPKPVTEPTQPSRPIGEVLATFMAEKNIRWGEIIGGLLIVCCSAALVISLWSRIQEIPILKFMIFTTVNAALFGAGLFVHHRWKVPTTGRAILSIATLLVPLNLLAFAAFSFQLQTPSHWPLITQAISVSLFAWLTYIAAKVIMPIAPKVQVGGYMLICIVVLLLQFLPADHSNQILLPCGFLIGLYVLSTHLSWWRMSTVFNSQTDDQHQKYTDDAKARHLFFMLFTQSFACIAPLALLIHLTGLYRQTLQDISPLISLFAMPSLAICMPLWQSKLTIKAKYRTIACAICLIGFTLMLLAIASAWPHPNVLLPSLILNMTVMLVLSLLFKRFAIATIWMTRLAMVWLTMGWVLSVHLITGAIAWDSSNARQLIDALMSVSTGKALILPILIAVGLAQWHRYHRNIKAMRGDWSTAFLIGLFSILLIIAKGFGNHVDAEHITWIFVLYSILTLFSAWQLRLSLLTYCSVILMQLGLFQLMVFDHPWPTLPWGNSLLSGATVCTIGVLMTCFPFKPKAARKIRSVFFRPWAICGIGLSSVACVIMCMQLSSSDLPGSINCRLFWIAGLWMTLALCMTSLAMFTLSQTALLIAMLLMVHERMLSGLPNDFAYQSLFHTPAYWQTQLLVLGMNGLVWLAIRLLLEKWQRDENATPTLRTRCISHLNRVITAPLPLLDDVLAWLSLAGSVSLGVWSIGVHVLAELGAWQHIQTPSDYATNSARDTAGMMTWCVLGLTMLIFVIRLFKRNRIASLCALSVGWLIATALISAPFATQHNVINIWRHLLTGSCFFGISALIFMPHTLRQKTMLAIDSQQQDRVIYWVYSLFALPALVLTLGCMLVLVQFPHATEGLFTEILNGQSHVSILLHAIMYSPVVLILVTLVMLGLTRQQRSFASMAAALATCSVFSIEACIFAYIDISDWIAGIAALVQINAVIAAVLALAWEQLSIWLNKQDLQKRYPRWPLLLGRFSMSVGLILGAIAIFFTPVYGPDILAEFGNPWAIGSFILVELALLRISPKQVYQQLPVSFWCLMSVIMLSMVLAPWDTGAWTSFHILSVGWVIAGWILLLTLGRHTNKLSEAGWQETYLTILTFSKNHNAQIQHDLSCTHCQYNLRGLNGNGTCPECGQNIHQTIDDVSSKLDITWAANLQKTRMQTAGSILACICLGMLFALRGGWDDPQSPWWSMGVLLGVTTLSMALAAWTPRQNFAYLGGLAACLCASIGFDQFMPDLSNLHDVSYIINLVNVNLAILAICGLAWLVIENKYLKHRLSETGKLNLPPLHLTALIASTVILTVISGQVLYSLIAYQHGNTGSPIQQIAISSWLAIIFTGTLAIACVKEAFKKQIPAVMYMLGLIGLTQALSVLPIPAQSIELILAMTASAYVLITNLMLHILKQRNRMQELIADALFLPYANIAFSIAALCCGIGISLVHPSMTMRGIACALPLINALAMFILQKQGIWRDLRAYTFALLCVFPLLVSWVWISPDTPALWPNRAVGYMETYVLLSAMLSWFISRQHRKLDEQDRESGQAICNKAYAILTTIAAITIVYLSKHQITSVLNIQDFAMTRPIAYGMIASYSLMIILFVFFALKDRFDPMSLSMSYRHLYVYAAQILGGLMTLHLKLAMPWLFKGIVTAYWPLVILGVALAGIAIGQWCNRRNLSVVGKPLTNTGTWLPLVACIEIFIGNSAIDYSLILLAVGAVYMVLAIMKRSFALGILATLALNGSHWYLLHRTPGLGITEHPQLWIIPLALAILSAGYLNRKQLSEDQSRFIHYGCLLAIYLSSTLDVFLIGVAQAPWLPLVLAGLSIIGIFIGLAKRIRSYLFLGTGFLCLSLLTMIWHAATNMGWTWIWYVAGIALGIAIITVFALFEKKKNEMNKVIDGVKDWES
jgi:hypothetical protein